MQIKFYITRYLITSILIIFTLIPLIAQQDPQITETFFPDPEIDFPTPTLNIKEDRFASYNEIMDWIDNNILTSPFVRLEFVGTTPLGYKIPVLYLSKGDSEDKLKVWMQGLLHGNEPAGGEGLLYLAHSILNTPGNDNILDHLSIAILPIANVDGYVSMSRRSSVGYDLNRDQTKYADPVSSIIKKAFIEWNPEISYDFHEYQPSRKEFTGIGPNGGSSSYDVLFLPSGYPNIPEELRTASKNIFQKEAEAILNSHGYSYNYYFSADVSGEELVLKRGAQSPHSSSTSYALSNSISMLVETRGIGLGRTSFARRTYSTFLVANEALKSAIKHKKEIKRILNTALINTITLKNNIAVTASPIEYYDTLLFIDLKTNKLIQQRLKIRDAESMTPEIVRPRPRGYVIEYGAEKEIEILLLLGLEIEKIEKDTSLLVESFRITGYTEAEKTWENINTAKVECSLFTHKRSFPEGTYFLSLQQKNANYAISLLEPETINGFISYRVTQVSDGDTLKVHRVLENLH